MPVLRALVISIFVLAPAVQAEARRVRFDGSDYDIYEMDPRCSALRLIARDGDTGRFRNANSVARWAAEHGEQLVFAANAGIFRNDRRPLGLLIADGRRVSPLNTGSGAGNFFLKPNGVFFATAAGARIVDTAAFVEQPGVRIATQSGPLLLREGVIHPAFRPGSKNKVVRSAVGVRSGHELVFVISAGPVNFHELAALFRDELRCSDALYLDGAISAMYAPEIGRYDSGGDFAALFAVLTPANRPAEDACLAKEAPRHRAKR